MAVEYPLIGDVEQYKGREVAARFIGPDFLAHVDGQQIGCYWISPEAARAAGRRHVDQVEREKKRKSA